jgi:hypothetical protein
MIERWNSKKIMKNVHLILKGEEYLQIRLNKKIPRIKYSEQIVIFLLTLIVRVKRLIVML